MTKIGVVCLEVFNSEITDESTIKFVVGKDYKKILNSDVKSTYKT